MKEVHMRRFLLIVSVLLCTHVINATDVLNWETTYYIWNFGLISSCDKGLIKNPIDYFLHATRCDSGLYQDSKPGDVLWVKCRFIPFFYKHILPSLTGPVILLIADGDESFPTDCGKNFNVEDLLAHHTIGHVFAQNNEYAGLQTNVTSIPIGMDFHTVAYKGRNGGWGEKGLPCEQEQQLQAILSTLKPTHQRKKRAFVDFQLADTMHGDFKRYLQFGEDRQSIFQQLLQTGVVDYGNFMRRSELWRTKGTYAFSISPHGNGLDCHRTWEDLVLGSIVIVKTSLLDCLYEELPVVILQDWSEITQSNMDKWLVQYADAFTNPEYRKKLTHEYWFSKIRKKAQQYKGK